MAGEGGGRRVSRTDPRSVTTVSGRPGPGPFRQDDGVPSRTERDVPLRQLTQGRAALTQHVIALSADDSHQGLDNGALQLLQYCTGENLTAVLTSGSCIPSAFRELLSVWT